MLTFTGTGRLFIVAGVTDMRKSYNGLCGVVRNRLKDDPMSRDLFFFCNRAKNRLKVLVSDESGMWVYAKRLDRGTFAWPANADDGEKIEYRPEQIALLLQGVDADKLSPRRWRRRAARSAQSDTQKTNLPRPRTSPST